MGRPDSKLEVTDSPNLFFKFPRQLCWHFFIFRRFFENSPTHKTSNNTNDAQTKIGLSPNIPQITTHESYRAARYHLYQRHRQACQHSESMGPLPDGPCHDHQQSSHELRRSDHDDARMSSLQIRRSSLSNRCKVFRHVREQREIGVNGTKPNNGLIPLSKTLDAFGMWVVSQVSCFSILPILL